ncbi:hypothetical protein K438DRAFT_2022316 [Mycena galopus ATCC 62051]|nr:hypothetical protein K438DRAFT_2022316 [Mycena galopus ATCC 62051]
MHSLTRSLFKGLRRSGTLRCRLAFGVFPRQPIMPSFSLRSYSDGPDEDLDPPVELPLDAFIRITPRHLVRTAFPDQGVLPGDIPPNWDLDATPIELHPFPLYEYGLVDLHPGGDSCSYRKEGWQALLISKDHKEYLVQYDATYYLWNKEGDEVWHITAPTDLKHLFEALRDPKKLSKTPMEKLVSTPYLRLKGVSLRDIPEEWMEAYEDFEGFPEKRYGIKLGDTLLINPFRGALLIERDTFSNDPDYYLYYTEDTEKVWRITGCLELAEIVKALNEPEKLGLTLEVVLGPLLREGGILLTDIPPPWTAFIPNYLFHEIYALGQEYELKGLQPLLVNDYGEYVLAESKGRYYLNYLGEDGDALWRITSKKLINIVKRLDDVEKVKKTKVERRKYSREQ